MCGIRITRCTGIDCTGISRKRNAGRFRENRGKGTSQAVQDAITKSYEGSTVKEAYVAGADGAKKYKVVLVDKDQKEQTVVLNEKGEVIE